MQKGMLFGLVLSIILFWLQNERIKEIQSERMNRGLPPLNIHLDYGSCLKIMFWMVIIFGVIGWII